MRVALVVHKFPPASLGGTEIYTHNLARELSRQGHDVFVFYRHDEAGVRESDTTWEEREGFRVCRVSRPLDIASAPAFTQFLDTFFNRGIERAFQRFLDKVEPDIIHFQHVMSLSYRLIGLAKQRDLPSLLTLHDYWFICANSQLIWPDGQVCRGKALGLNCARCVLTARVNSPLLQLLRPAIAPLLGIRDALVRRTALAADLLIAPSHFLIQQYNEAGFPADRFVYLENGIDVERIRRYRHQPSPDGKLRFTYLGSLAWQKGVHVLVKAFQGIPAEEAVLKIYGDPTVFPDYAAHLQEIADPTSTRFEGLVPNEEVGRVLAETDVVVVPSLWYENSPVVIEEAFAAGVPVVASKIGALTEKVRNGISGLLCNTGDVTDWRNTLFRLARDRKAVNEASSTTPRATDIRNHTTRLARIYAEYSGTSTS
ncbi:MAG: glycosyltransferase family 4 protein [Chloroflexota bacterium]|nr:glycosyltransferase family 4 protein [Chloroflexota bacterium]